MEITSDGFSQYGVTYHVSDFIYFRPHDSNVGVLEIGQILEVDPFELEISVHLFGRFDDYKLESDEPISDLDEVCDKIKWKAQY